MEKGSTNYILMYIFLILLGLTIGFYTYCNQIDGVYVNVPIKFHYWENTNVVTHQTTKLVYSPGEIVYAKIIAHKGKIWPSIIQWNLVDGCRHAYLSKESTLEVGRNERIVAIEKIPEDIVCEGEVYFHGTTTFELNLIRAHISIPLQTNVFTVKGNKNE